ncbi:MAG: aminotransferase class I/II-fold pyridoxal phosphate-dependent enzyme [Ilumatobacteraceae bacterium]
MREAREWRTEQAQRISRALDRFRRVMADRPGGFELVTAGAFFGWVRHPFAETPTAEVVKRLVLDHDVLVIPGTAFTPTDERWLRFSFANLDESELDELAVRLSEVDGRRSARSDRPSGRGIDGSTPLEDHHFAVGHEPTGGRPGLRHQVAPAVGVDETGGLRRTDGGVAGGERAVPGSPIPGLDRSSRSRPAASFMQ